jgi:hypothetical protein
MSILILFSSLERAEVGKKVSVHLLVANTSVYTTDGPNLHDIISQKTVASGLKNVYKTWKESGVSYL